MLSPASSPSTAAMDPSTCDSPSTTVTDRSTCDSSSTHSNEVTAGTPSGSKWKLRALEKKVRNTKVSDDDLRTIIELWKLEEFDLKQPKEVVDVVEQMLGMEGIQWPSDSYRRQMIRLKLDVSIKNVLKRYGRVILPRSLI